MKYHFTKFLNFFQFQTLPPPQKSTDRVCATRPTFCHWIVALEYFRYHMRIHHFVVLALVLTRLHSCAMNMTAEKSC